MHSFFFSVTLHLLRGDTLSKPILIKSSIWPGDYILCRRVGTQSSWRGEGKYGTLAIAKVFAPWSSGNWQRKNGKEPFIIDSPPQTSMHLLPEQFPLLVTKHFNTCAYQAIFFQTATHFMYHATQWSFFIKLKQQH